MRSQKILRRKEAIEQGYDLVFRYEVRVDCSKNISDNLYLLVCNLEETDLVSALLSGRQGLLAAQKHHLSFDDSLLRQGFSDMPKKEVF